ncbi:MAG TPA: NPCBM/NEW2 domain-containing protein [Gemmataceae bacterium]|nr:NPCBM/NEW2 domain-containing protein [Gemmataceae bacterium]
MSLSLCLSVSLSLVAMLILGAPAKEPASAAFILHTTEGKNFSGPLAKLTAEGAIRLGGEQPILVPGQEVVSLRRALPLPDYPKKNVVILTNGDRIPLDPDPIRLEEGRLFFHVASPLVGPGGQGVKVPRGFVAVLWLAPPSGTDADLLARSLLTGTRKQDVLLLANGDRVEGKVTAIDSAKGCTVLAGQREVKVAFGQLAAIAFNTELQARFRPLKTYSHVVLAKGGRLSFASLQLDADKNRLEGKTLFGARLEFPLTHLVAVEPRLGPVVFLSDIKPKSYQHTPFLDVSWPLVTDAAVSGRPLRLAGSTFDKGLGTHSQCRVNYALDGGYRWFQALVGLDERSGKRGRVRISVLVDGKEQDLGCNKELTAKDAPLPVRIDVRKARELTLLVRFGSFGDVEGHVNWADARLIR